MSRTIGLDLALRTLANGFGGLVNDRRKDSARRRRFEEERQAMMQRLHRVAAHFSREQLEHLASNMTRIKLKYEPFSAVARTD